MGWHEEINWEKSLKAKDDFSGMNHRNPNCPEKLIWQATICKTLT